MADETQRDPDSMPTVDPSERVPRTRPAAEPRDPGPPAKRIGPYEILEEIGRGGMGIVYKAFQPGLNRTVALKVLIAGEDASRESIARFHHEASAVARLGHHPNIVPVYDVGEVPGHGPDETARVHYIAMHYVEGPSLDRLIEEERITPRQAARVARQIASALAHAHEHGILHRDVKPANILLARAGGEQDGATHRDVRGVSPAEGRVTATSPQGEPMLTDFGLAKDVQSETRMTRSGVTLGTPQYMPPEQAEGRLEDVDARSDVYGLGAALYEMLTLVPPFEGNTVMEVVRHVLVRDPVAPRRLRPEVDRDLETICLRCLEKDPARRYASARALEEDLNRYLDGAAIHARPISLSERLARRMRRNKALSLALAAAALLLAAGTVVAVVAVSASRRASESEQARDAQTDRAGEAERLLEKNQKVAKILFTAQARLSRPLARLKEVFYDSSQDTALWEDAKKELLRGRDAYRAAAETDPVSQAASLAIQGWLTRLGGGVDEAAALFAEARATDPEVGWSDLLEAMGFLAEYVTDRPGRAFVTGSLGLSFRDPEPESPRMAAARERFLVLAGRLHENRVWGVQMSPAFAEGLEGVRRALGDDAAAAEEGLSRALALPEFFWVEEELLLARAKARYILGDFEDGLDDARIFLERCPRSALAWTILGDLQHAVAVTRDRAGEDPLPALADSAASYRRAVEFRPDLGGSWNNLGVVLRETGEEQQSRGRDSEEALEASLAAFDRARALLPGFVYARGNQAGVYVRLALALARGGEDPRDVLGKAIALSSEALALDGSYTNAFVTRALARIHLGEAQGDRGEDPRPLFRLALEDCSAALGLDGADVEAHLNRGFAGMRLGEAESLRGQDPRATLKTALADLDRALELAPDSVEAFNNRASSWQLLASAEGARGLDPGPSLERAVADYGEALSRSPGLHKALLNRAQAYQKLGDLGTARGEDGRASYALALADADAVLQEASGDATARYVRGSVRMDFAEAAARADEDPRPLIRDAIADFEAALEANPSLLPALNGLANAFKHLGDDLAARKADPREAYRQAASVFERALEIHPGYIPVLVNRATVLLGLGAAHLVRGEDGDPWFEEARACFRRALEIHPRLWQAHTNLGLLYERWGRPAQAAAAYEQAHEIVGDGYPRLETLLARARAQAALPLWKRHFERGFDFLRDGFYAGARAPLEEGLAAAKSRNEPAEGELPADLVRAHVALARILSVALEGRPWPGEEARPVEEADAQRLEALAREHLADALALGWTKPDTVDTDPDFAPLRAREGFAAWWRSATTR